jgi:hypothetical protein
VAGGQVSLQLIINGNWNDNDILRLSLAMPSTSQDSTVSLYHSTESACEDFLFLDSALKGDKISSCGDGLQASHRCTVSLSLPLYGATYKVNLIRRIFPTEPQTRRSLLTEHYLKLGESQIFSVKFALSNENPLTSTGKRKFNTIPLALSSLRRGICKKEEIERLDVDCNKYRVRFDDLQNISKLSCQLELQSSSANVVNVLTRVAAFLYKAENAEKDVVFTLLFEMDIVRLEADIVDNIRTEHVRLTLRDPTLVLSHSFIDVVRSVGEVSLTNTSKSSWAVYLRIPYEPRMSPISSSVPMIDNILAQDTLKIKQVMDSSSDKGLIVCCAFCGNLVSRISFSAIKPLPSGLLDDVSFLFPMISLFLQFQP